MLLVFLGLYVVLGIGCLVGGIRRHARTAVTLGVVTLALAVAFLVVWTLYVLGATHWTVSLLQALLSPMPESLVEPEALSGLPLRPADPRRGCDRTGRRRLPVGDPGDRPRRRGPFSDCATKLSAAVAVRT